MWLAVSWSDRPTSYVIWHFVNFSFSSLFDLTSCSLMFICSILLWIHGFHLKAVLWRPFCHRAHFYGVVPSACYYHWRVFALFYFLTSVVINFDPIIWTPTELQFQVANYSPEPQDKNLFRQPHTGKSIFEFDHLNNNSRHADFQKKTVIVSSYGIYYCELLICYCK